MPGTTPFVNLLQQVQHKCVESIQPVMTVSSEKSRQFLYHAPSTSLIPTRRRSSLGAFTRTNKTTVTCIATAVVLLFVFLVKPFGPTAASGADGSDTPWWRGSATYGRTGMQLMHDLPAELVPRPESDHKLVIVGDVHACSKELQDLLNATSFRAGTDYLIMTGDLLSKGPDPKGTVALLRSVNATSVRGNYEDRLLAEIDRPKPTRPAPASDADDASARPLTVDDVLTADDIAWLRSMPAMLRIPSTNADNIVVHGGLVAGRGLEGQTIEETIALRTLVSQRRWFSSADQIGSDAAGGGGRRWNAAWEEAQRAVVAARDAAREAGAADETPKPVRVVYGHDSDADLLRWKWSYGLNTRCVAGGRLTAMVMHGSGLIQLVHVPCEDYE